MIRKFFTNYPWGVSRDRSIDRATILDLLSLLEYQASREAKRKKAGYDIDRMDGTEIIFTYILDAMKVPPEGDVKTLKGENKNFVKECTFRRQWFEELFYSYYILEKHSNKLTINKVLEIMETEIRDNILRHYK